jgi:hypothetical protein
MAKKANVERDVNAQQSLESVKGEIQQAVYGINADIAGAFERMESVAVCQSKAKQAEAAYEDSLSEYCQWLHDNGFTASQYRQADVRKFADKDDPAYKAHKAFYDDAKINYASKLASSGEYSEVDLMPLYSMTKKAIEAAGHPKRVSIALVELKDDANQGIRKIRERLETLESRDENGDPVAKSEAERDAASLAAIYKRRMADEDMPADELKHKIAALQVCAVEQECELEYIALISEI